MEKYTIDELVMELIGRIDPVGDTRIDNERFENMKTLIRVIDKLTFELEDSVRVHYNAQEFSIRRAIDTVNGFKVNTLDYLTDDIVDSTLFDKTLLKIIKGKNVGRDDFYSQLEKILQEEE